MKRGFTLIELIVVIIIVGILAAVGLTQYSTTVEKSRLAEAKTRIGAMRDLVQEYYLNNGTTTGITNSYLGVDNTCTSDSFFKYSVGGGILGAWKSLIAERCQAGAGGKEPGATRYYFYFRFYPGTGQGSWYCCSGSLAPIGSSCSPNVGCFGLPGQ